MKILICERPYATRHLVGMFARKNGKYTRPIVAKFLDIRIEDFMPDSVLISKHASNYIAKLPDIPEIGQINQYFIADSNLIARMDLSEQEAMEYLHAGKHIMLPDSPESPYWRFSKAPWWEFSTCFDDNDGYIKAPKIPRQNEPNPEEIDERIDEFEQNKGEIKVISPQILQKQLDSGVEESYIERLQRI